jgi:hypothetical protein
LVRLFIHDPPRGKSRRKIISVRTGWERPPACSRPRKQDDLGIGPGNRVDFPADRCTFLVSEVVEALDVEHQAIPGANAGIA